MLPRPHKVVVKTEPETNTRYYVEVDNPDSLWARSLISQGKLASRWNGFEIDWLMLARQKLELVTVAAGLQKSPRRSFFDGIISLIDGIQDAAGESGYPIHPVVRFEPIDESAATAPDTEVVGLPGPEDYRCSLETMHHDLLYESPSYGTLMKNALAGVRRAAVAEAAVKRAMDGREEIIRQLQEENARLKKQLEEKEVVNGYAAVRNDDGDCRIELDRWCYDRAMDECIAFINGEDNPRNWLLFKIGAEIPLETKTIVKVEPKTEGGN